MQYSTERLLPLVACGVIAASIAGAAFGYFKLNDLTHPPAATSSPTPSMPLQPSASKPPVLTELPSAKREGDFKLVAKQDFEKAAAVGSFEQVYGAKLTGYDDFFDHDNRGLGYYEPDQVLSAKDGILNYHLHTADGKPLVAAVTPTGYEGQRYGRYVVRFRADLAEGYRLAFLLWPDSNVWEDGELDFPEVDLTEMGNAEKPGSINGFAHDVTGNPKFNHLRFITRESAQEWHTAAIEWTPDYVSFELDGREVRTTNRAAIPTGKMHWVLQTQTSSTKRVAPQADVSGDVEVDWYAQYAYDPKD